jgi:N-acetylmuramoyl-L-alanine amidase
MNLQINEKLIPLGHPNRPGTKLDQLLAGVVHYTANDAPGADDLMNAAYFGRSYKRDVTGKCLEINGKKFAFGSAHAICDMDSVTHTIPYNEVAWGCGDRQLPWDSVYKGQKKLAHDIFGNRQNYLTVSWEICCNDQIHTSGAEDTMNDPDWEGACQVCRWEIAKFLAERKLKPIFELRRPGPGEFLIVRHYDLTGKNCPAPFVKSLDEWKRFQAELLRLC